MTFLDNCDMTQSMLKVRKYRRTWNLTMTLINLPYILVLLEKKKDMIKETHTEENRVDSSLYTLKPCLHWKWPTLSQSNLLGGLTPPQSCSLTRDQVIHSIKWANNFVSYYLLISNKYMHLFAWLGYCRFLHTIE